MTPQENRPPDTSIPDDEGHDRKSKIGSTSSTPDRDPDDGESGCPAVSEDIPSADLVKTSCGDNHNLGLDSSGLAYSLPSPLDFDVFPPDSRHRVVDVVCGKEHCLLLTEHGQVYSWGGGSRGQLGHGGLSSESSPRLISALDGLRITKIAAGGWHSACISQFNDLYMVGERPFQKLHILRVSNYAPLGYVTVRLERKRTACPNH